MWAAGSEVRSGLDRSKRQLTAEAQDFAYARGLRLEHRTLPLAELAVRFDLHALHFACPTALPQPTDNPVNHEHGKWRGRTFQQCRWRRARHQTVARMAADHVTV